MTATKPTPTGRPKRGMSVHVTWTPPSGLQRLERLRVGWSMPTMRPAPNLRFMTDDGWAPDPEYAKYPDHDLHDVSLVVLEAERAYIRQAASLGDVAENDAEPLADAVIAAALPVVRQ